MEENFKNLNKQIASFILVSFALTGSSAAAENTQNSAAEVKASARQEMMLMYAAPGYFKKEKIVTPRNNQIMMKYAAPEFRPQNTKKESWWQKFLNKFKGVNK